MRIGIDCSTFLNPGRGEGAGVGHYTFFLVKHLLALDCENEYVLFFNDIFAAEAVRALTEGRENVSIRLLPFHAYKKYLPFFYSHLFSAWALAKECLDIFHAPANVFPLAYRGNTVVTMHDLAIYKHPEWFPKGILRQTFSKKILVPKSLQKAKKIIAVSESSKQDIEEIFGIAPEKISVVYEGVSKPDIRDAREATSGLSNLASREELYQKYPLHDPYILFLGTLEPRKNIPAFIEGFAMALEEMKKRGEDSDAQLVVAGAKGWKYEKIFQAMKQANCRLQEFFGTKKEYITYLGYIASREKFSLLANARIFAFPSLYEGFGIPVLEAMSAGTPVLTSRISSLPRMWNRMMRVPSEKNCANF